MTEEGLISREEAVARIDAGQLDQLLHPMIDPSAEVEVVATLGSTHPRGPRRGRSCSTQTSPRSAAGRARGRAPRALGDDLDDIHG